MQTWIEIYELLDDSHGGCDRCRADDVLDADERPVRYDLVTEQRICCPACLSLVRDWYAEGGVGQYTTTRR